MDRATAIIQAINELAMAKIDVMDIRDKVRNIEVKTVKVDFQCTLYYLDKAIKDLETVKEFYGVL